MRAVRVACCALMAAILCVGRASGWSTHGLHVVARIAWSQMSPSARRGAQDLLGTEDFVLSMTWANDITAERPDTYNWHFVLIPVGEQKYSAARDCQSTPKGDCLIAELERARHDVSDTTLPKPKRTEALKFLTHLVADINQPIHTIDNHDEGGNKAMTLLGGQQTPRILTLHTVWDTHLIAARQLDDAAYADLLINEMKTERLSGVPIDFVAWAEESHQVAVKYVYTYPGFTPAGPPKAPVPLDADYQRKGQSALDHQLKLGGVRLAQVLNSVFGQR